MKRVGPQTPLLCPCCGQSVAEVRDAKAIVGMVAMPQIDRTLAEYFAAHIGRWLTTEALVSALYSTRADGGPLLAAGNLRVRVHHLKMRLSGTPLMIESAPRASAFGRRLIWREAHREA